VFFIVGEHDAGADGGPHLCIVAGDLFGQAGGEQALVRVFIAERDKGQIGFADGLAEDGGDLLAGSFIAGDVADAAAFECQPEQFFGRGCSDVAGVDQDHLPVRTIVVAVDAGLFDQTDGAEQVGIEIARPQVTDVGAGMGIECDLREMDARNGSYAGRLVGPNAAEIDDFFSARRP